MFFRPDSVWVQWFKEVILKGSVHNLLDNIATTILLLDSEQTGQIAEWGVSSHKAQASEWWNG